MTAIVAELRTAIAALQAVASASGEHVLPSVHLGVCPDEELWCAVGNEFGARFLETLYPETPLEKPSRIRSWETRVGNVSISWQLNAEPLLVQHAEEVCHGDEVGTG